MLRVCVIGLGPIGNLHATLHKADPLAELVGVCDINKQRADAAAARLGVPAFYDAQTMLDALKPDVCSIATAGFENGSDHYEVTLQAFEAGCHVLGEKPICNEIDRAAEMVRVAHEQRRCFGIDFNHRFTPAAQLAKRWQNEGRLGHLLFVNMSMWIMNPRESSPYFQLKALHPHTVDVMRHFCGDITHVQAFVERPSFRKKAGDAMLSINGINVKFANGGIGYLLKDCEPSDLIAAVRAAAMGHVPLDPRVAGALLPAAAAAVSQPNSSSTAARVRPYTSPTEPEASISRIRWPCTSAMCTYPASTREKKSLSSASKRSTTPTLRRERSSSNTR